MNRFHTAIYLSTERMNRKIDSLYVACNLCRELFSMKSRNTDLNEVESILEACQLRCRKTAPFGCVALCNRRHTVRGEHTNVSFFYWMCRSLTQCVADPIWGVCRCSYTLLPARDRYSIWRGFESISPTFNCGKCRSISSGRRDERTRGAANTLLAVFIVMQSKQEGGGIRKVAVCTASPAAWKPKGLSAGDGAPTWKMTRNGEIRDTV